MRDQCPSLKQEAQKSPPAPETMAREARDVRESRDPKLEVLKTSNFGPRTLARPANLARLS